MSTDATSDSTGRAHRHPCCAAPEDAGAMASAPPVPRGSTMARGAQATTDRNDTTTGKGEDQ